MKNMMKKGMYSDFWKNQLKLTKLLVHELKPKIVVVPNAFASEIFIKEFDVQPKSKDPDEDTGHHFVSIGGNKTPLFLGSMLSGQRALDVYSRQRLSWHIRKALKKVMFP